MAINIRNQLIERKIERCQKELKKSLGVDKLSKPQTIAELISFYDKNRGGGR